MVTASFKQLRGQRLVFLFPPEETENIYELMGAWDEVNQKSRFVVGEKVTWPDFLWENDGECMEHLGFKWFFSKSLSYHSQVVSMKLDLMAVSDMPHTSARWTSSFPASPPSAFVQSCRQFTEDTKCR